MDFRRFGIKLKEKRKMCGISCQELSELCHVNNGYIRQIEAGVKFPSMQLLLNICDILSTSPNYLLEYVEEDNSEKEILTRIHKLTPCQKRTLIVILDAYIEAQSKF